MTTRRYFIKSLSALAGASAFGTDLFAATNSGKKLFFEISLAEWSLHKSIWGGKMTNLDFPLKAKRDFGIETVEYVNTLFGSKTTSFKDNGKSQAYLRELLMRCADNGIKNHLIMCDAEGEMGHPDKNKRIETVENHKKWVEAAKFLGCATIRVNAGGSGTATELAKTAADGLAMLSEFAATMDINVIVENHGGYSSNGEWLAGVMKSVNMKNCGTLPDFGNFCMKRDVSNWRICNDEYDRYKGTAELMPFAKGVSAKANDFEQNGNEKVMDYVKLMKIVKDAGFRGYVGIEYEGDVLSEDDGIKATKALLLKVGEMLS
jgi:sugar phosphate isomerase/epimerase